MRLPLRIKPKRSWKFQTNWCLLSESSLASIKKTLEAGNSSRPAPRPHRASQRFPSPTRPLGEQVGLEYIALHPAAPDIDQLDLWKKHLLPSFGRK